MVGLARTEGWWASVGAAPAVFTDNFTRANQNLEASANWTLVAGGVAGSAAVVSNQLAVRPLSIGEGAYLCPNQGSANHYTQAMLKSATDNNAIYYPVAVRVTDLNNFIGLRQFQGTLQMHKRVAGTFTLLASLARTHVLDDVLRIQANGTAITGYLNGTPTLGPITVAEFTSVTRQGLIVRGTTDFSPALDNFEAGTL
jgi:hypothetical protein